MAALIAIWKSLNKIGRSEQKDFGEIIPRLEVGRLSLYGGAWLAAADVAVNLQVIVH